MRTLCVFLRKQTHPDGFTSEQPTTLCGGGNENQSTPRAVYTTKLRLTLRVILVMKMVVNVSVTGESQVNGLNMPLRVLYQPSLPHSSAEESIRHFSPVRIGGGQPAFFEKSTTLCLHSYQHCKPGLIQANGEGVVQLPVEDSNKREEGIQIKDFHVIRFLGDCDHKCSHCGAVFWLCRGCNRKGASEASDLDAKTKQEGDQQALDMHLGALLLDYRLISQRKTHKRHKRTEMQDILATLQRRNGAVFIGRKTQRSLRAIPAEMAPKRATRVNTSHRNPTTYHSSPMPQLHAMIDQGVTAALAARDATRNGEMTSHTWEWAHEGVVETKPMFERMVTVFRNKNCSLEIRSKFPLNMTDKYCPEGNVIRSSRMPSLRSWTVERYVGELMDRKSALFCSGTCQAENKRKLDKNIPQGQTTTLEAECGSSL
ncbi:hypothetical protein Tco_1101586 [Tanacetum coccineum]